MKKVTLFVMVTLGTILMAACSGGDSNPTAPTPPPTQSTQLPPTQVMATVFVFEGRYRVDGYRQGTWERTHLFEIIVPPVASAVTGDLTLTLSGVCVLVPTNCTASLIDRVKSQELDITFYGPTGALLDSEPIYGTTGTWTYSAQRWVPGTYRLVINNGQTIPREYTLSGKVQAWR